MELFKILGRIAVETDEAIEGLEEVSEKAEQTSDNLDDLDKKGKDSGSKLGKAFGLIGKGAVAMGKTIASGIAIGVAAFAGLTMKAMSLGGELEQNMGGSEAVFKEFAETIQETARSAFANMGLSTSNYLATANKMGALFQGAGFSVEQSMNMSTQCMQRAADVASIMGISTEAAMEAIAGAAKGNFTMMDNLGVAMNDTTLQAYALSLGIEKSTTEMTNQEKIGLAMQMFLDKTSYAIGNYAKENDTLAGSLATAKAAFTNFLDGSGNSQQLVDAWSKATDVIVRNLTELLPRLIQGLSEVFNGLIPLLPELMQSLLPAIIDGAIMLVQALVDSLPMLMATIIDALPTFIAGFVQIFQGIVEAFPQLMQMIVDTLPTLVPMLVDAIVQMVMILVNNLDEIIVLLVEALPIIIVGIIDGLMDNLPMIIEGLIQLVIGIVNNLPTIIQSLIEAIPTIISMLIQGLFNSLPTLIQGIFQLISSLASATIEYLKNYWSNILNIFTNGGSWFTSNVWTPIKNGCSQAWDKMKQGASSAWSGIQNVFSNVGNFFKNTFSNAWTAVKNVFSTGGKVFDGIKDGIVTAFKTIVNGLIGGINKVVATPFNAINNVLKSLKSIDILGIKPFGWVQTFNVPQIPTLATGGVLRKGQVGFLEGDGDEAVVPLEKNTGWIEKVASEINNYNSLNLDARSNFNTLSQQNALVDVVRTEVGERLSNMEMMMSTVIQLLQTYFPELLEAFDVRLVLNDGVLVARLTPKIDQMLGQIYKRKERG